MRADHRAILLTRRHFSPGLFSVTFAAAELARNTAPGQFVMLGLPDRARPYLRRAYSVADADPERGTVEFLVKTIGLGTAALERLAEGSEVWLLGPLGNGFSFFGLAAGEQVAVVAGGVGAAPFPLLLRVLRGMGVAADLFLGGRNAADLAFRERFESLVTGHAILATDDGSLGEKGVVTAAFERKLGQTRYARLYACGPMAMLVALSRAVARARLTAEFSTEAEMGCGFGACLGCVIPGAEKPFLVSCLEGPIFPPGKIDWEKIS